MAKDKLTAEERELVKWLKQKHKNAERTAKAAARTGNYGEAQRIIGQAEAYAFTVIYVQHLARLR